MGTRSSTKTKDSLIPQERIENKIILVRGQKVILDSHLAELYGVSTGHLKRAVNRNRSRFPDDFMFELTREESEVLRCQIGISKKGRGGTRYLPYAFTQEGVAMLSSVLNSDRAIQVNIQIMRTFTKLRELMIHQKDWAYKIEDLERKYKDHDGKIDAIFNAIKQLLNSPERPKRRIGFHP